MGLYNLSGEYSLPNNECVICNSKEVIPIIDDGGRDSFDYECQGNCKKHIAISKFGLDRLEEIKSNPRAQEEIKEDIQNSLEDRYLLNSNTINFFGGYDYEDTSIEKTYERWISGDLFGIPSKYKGISSDELDRIYEHQNEIFNIKEKEELNEIIKSFESKKEKSSRPKKLIEKELSLINEVLEGNYDGEVPVRIGNIELDTYILKNIPFFYNKLIDGIVDCSMILSPNQKKLIGLQRKLEIASIYAKVLIDYHQFISNSHSVDEEKFNEQELEKLNVKLDLILEKVSRLEYGQEIVFDEVDSLREFAKTLKKNDFKNMVVGKVGTLLMKKFIDGDLAKEIVTKLIGEDTAKLLGF